MQSDRGHLKVSPALQGPRQELRLNGTRIGDKHLHCFGFDRRGSCGWLCGAHGFHATIMPKSAWTVCSPRHTVLVIIRKCMPTFAGLLLCTTFAAGHSPARRATATGNPALAAQTADFITFPIAATCPVPRWTVLSKSCCVWDAGIASLLTAQTPELLSSPF